MAEAALSRALPGDLIEIAMTDDTRPFWEAAREERLVAQACDNCGTFRMPPSPMCPACRSRASHWPTLSGKGVLYSYTIAHKLPFPDHPGELFHVPALVELPDAGGVRLYASLVNVAETDIRIGMPLSVIWVEAAADGWKAPAFIPAPR
jgi:uncharacterized OB-fold protein